jgi:serine phosphatase RsbU (regulator of sigma subunit)
VPASSQGETGIGFTLALGVANTASAEWRETALRAALFTVPVFLALLHLAFYWFNPKTRENLFFSACMAVFAFMVFRDFEIARTAVPSQVDLLNRLAAPGPIALILFGLLTYYAVRTRPFPRTWIAFTAAAAVLIPACFLDPGTFSSSWYFYFGAMVAEIARVEVKGKPVKREGVAILLVGMTVQAVFVILQLLVNFDLIPPIGGNRGVYVFGMLAFAVGMSLFLAYSFARTSFHLERRLAEVQTLSSQILEQERTAHARELEKRLLEADNARKGKELEAGRALQLSMLPLSVPSVVGLDIAAAMTTASEVGGDYYDFRLSPNGSLVIAVGDATGHGVAAGIMVTAVKAVLATVGGEASLPTMLSECDRVLRGMNVRPLHMCLTVARLTPRSVAFCSAAMPPLLLCRAATGEVEELGVGGLPLGGRLSPGYQEQNASLAPGDTLLFATDGFHELQDPAGNALGFEGAKRALRSAGGAPASEVVARLTMDVSKWRGDREQADASPSSSYACSKTEHRPSRKLLNVRGAWLTEGVLGARRVPLGAAGRPRRRNLCRTADRRRTHARSCPRTGAHRGAGLRSVRRRPRQGPAATRRVLCCRHARGRLARRARRLPDRHARLAQPQPRLPRRPGGRGARARPSGRPGHGASN